MCLILLAWKRHRHYPLVLAANRDEFYDRPSAPAVFWQDAPDLLAGRDLQEGGTWLGITRTGRVAAVTNYRDPESRMNGAPSRGGLVSDYLRSRESPEAYLDRIAPAADRYNGFNLLVGDAGELCWFSNRGGRQRLAPGVYGLSNHLLDTPWPKVNRGREALLSLMEEGSDLQPERLLALLSDRTRPPDEHLPDTGVGMAWERVLAPLFIESPTYGTRSSTVLLIHRNGEVTFVERVFDGAAAPRTVRFSFRVPGGVAD